MKKIFLFLVASYLTFGATGQTLLDTAQNFSVKDIEGNTRVLFDILDENKIVVIDFFSTS
jgi:hypothetical protein